MTRKVFVSYSNWDIKTPFVSYCDDKFIQELSNKEKKYVNINSEFENEIVVKLPFKNIEKKALLTKEKKYNCFSGLFKLIKFN